MDDRIDYDPFSETIMDDPYPTYAKLRRDDPVHYMPEYDAWALSRFSDIWQASMDSRRLTVTEGNTPGQLLTRSQPATPMFGLEDPPRHTAIRSKIRGVFQPKAIAGAEGMIRNIVERAFEENDGGAIDVINQIGLVISVRVALSITGVPMEDAELMLEYTERFFARDPDTRSITEDGITAAGEMQGYFEDLVRRRRREGSSVSANDATALDHLLAIEIDGERLREDEICGSLQLLIHGGTETMPKVLATTLLRLAEHPEQRSLVAADPSQAEWAFRESLRLDMPTQFLGRRVTQSFELRGQRLNRGQAVIFLYAAANRDEEEFDRADDFDIHRRPERILSFGHGTHACLGRNVALLEGRTALQEILARTPNYTLDLDRAPRYRTEFVQGYQSLPLIPNSNGA